MAASGKVDAPAVETKVAEAKVGDPAAEVKVDATSHALNRRR